MAITKINRFAVQSLHEDTPLDIAEEMLNARGWSSVRENENILHIATSGELLNYQLTLEWQEDFSALLLCCYLPFEISKAHEQAALRMLEQVNRRLWLGHFELSEAQRMPTYRYTLMCRSLPVTFIADLLSDIFDVSLAECSRFFSTFQLVENGEERFQESFHAAVFETVGEA